MKSYKFYLGFQVFFIRVGDQHVLDFGSSIVPDSGSRPVSAGAFPRVILRVILRVIIGVGIDKLGCCREIRGSKDAIMISHPATC